MRKNKVVIIKLLVKYIQYAPRENNICRAPQAKKN